MRRLTIITLLILTVNIQATVVVTLHGFLRGEANFKKLSKEFSKKGDVVYNFVYPSRENTIEGHASQFVNWMQEIYSKHPSEDFAFISHSMGGLVLRCAMQDPKMAPFYPSKVVLVAPPNRGSIFARKLSKMPLIKGVFGRYAGKQLTIYKNFNHLGDFDPKTKVLVIAGNRGINPLIGAKNDGKVAVEETRLVNDHLFLEIPSVHSLICNSNMTINESYHFIHN